MNCVLPLDSNAREPMSGSRMTIEECSCCIWRLEKKGKAAGRAHVRKIVRAYASLSGTDALYRGKRWRAAGTGFFVYTVQLLLPVTTGRRSQQLNLLHRRSLQFDDE